MRQRSWWMLFADKHRKRDQRYLTKYTLTSSTRDCSYLSSLTELHTGDNAALLALLDAAMKKYEKPEKLPSDPKATPHAFWDSQPVPSLRKGRWIWCNLPGDCWLIVGILYSSGLYYSFISVNHRLICCLMDIHHALHSHCRWGWQWRGWGCNRAQ